MVKDVKETDCGWGNRTWYVCVYLGRLNPFERAIGQGTAGRVGVDRSAEGLTSPVLSRFIF